MAKITDHLYRSGVSDATLEIEDDGQTTITIHDNRIGPVKVKLNLADMIAWSFHFPTAMARTRAARLEAEAE